MGYNTINYIKKALPHTRCEKGGIIITLQTQPLMPHVRGNVKKPPHTKCKGGVIEEKKNVTYKNNPSVSSARGG